MTALSEQVGGSHYKDCKIQPVQYIEANELKFLEACVVKRVTRHDKPTGKGRQDIEKAIHELQLLLELRYGSAEAAKQKETPVRLKKGYTLCPVCKEVTTGKVGLENTCVQCGHRFELGMDTAYRQWGVGEERMDRIGQNGNDGEHYDKPWIPHYGGQCPVPVGTKVDIRYRDGEEIQGAVAGKDLATQSYWDRNGLSMDIMAYRLA